MDPELVLKLIRALEQHDAFVGVVKNELGFARPIADITGHRPGASAAACDRIILNYPEDPFGVLMSAKKKLVEMVR